MSNEFEQALFGDLEEAEGISDSSQQDSIAIASMAIDEEESENILAISMPTTQEDPIKSEIIEFDPERPYSFKDSMQEQGRLLHLLNDKLNKIDENTLNGENRGIFWDFKLELEQLAKETQKLSNFFSTEIPQKDRELINRTTLIKNQLVELYDLLKKLENGQYDRQIDEINKKLRKFMISTQERIKAYDENLKGSFSANLKSLNDLLRSFYDRELDNTQQFSQETQNLISDSHNKFKEISNDFALTSKRLKIFGLGILGAFIALGICFGVLSGFTYLKYVEYKDIETKMTSLSKRIDGIIIKRDKQNNLILNIPKNNTDFKEKQEFYEINIKEG